MRKVRKDFISLSKKDERFKLIDGKQKHNGNTQRNYYDY